MHAVYVIHPDLMVRMGLQSTQVHCVQCLVYSGGHPESFTLTPPPLQSFDCIAHFPLSISVVLEVSKSPASAAGTSALAVLMDSDKSTHGSRQAGERSLSSCRCLLPLAPALT